MEHQEAIELNAAEGYLLGDLTAAEHEAFEEHYADCEACFADVRDGATMMSAMRVDARVNARKHAPDNKVLWFGRNLIPTLAAAASFVVFIPTVVYQQAQLAAARTPRIVRPIVVADMRTERKVLRGEGPFQLEFRIPPTHPSPQYKCAIVDGNGRKVRDVPDLVPAADATLVDLWIPRGLLGPGNFSLVITGAGGALVNQIEITVQ